MRAPVPIRPGCIRAEGFGKSRIKPEHLIVAWTRESARPVKRRATIWRMDGNPGVEHALVLYRSSERADTRLRAVCERTSRMTVVVLARHEAEQGGCCDTRSTLWNRLCRDLASEDLSKAQLAVADPKGVEFHVLVAPDADAPAALAREAVERRADEIIIAGSGLGRLELRRLRRSSPVPVHN